MKNYGQISLTELEPFEKDALPRIGNILSADQCAHLVTAFTKHDGSAPKGSEAYKILNSLFARHIWLACSCAGSKLEIAPVMYVQSTRSKVRPFTLVRNYSRTFHDAGCPFNRVRDTKGHSLATRTKSNALGVMRVSSVASMKTGSGRVRHATSKSPTTPSIANVLFTVLEHAGCNRLSSRPRSLTDDARNIRLGLVSFHMDAKKTIPATEYFGTNLHKFSTIANRVKRAMRNSEWPTNLIPHGFVIGLCEVHREKNSLWLVEPQRGSQIPARWKITGRVRLPGPGTPGPNVAIGLIASPSIGHAPEIVQAYVHPANSVTDLTLVDSDLERQTLAILTEHLEEMKKRGNAYSVIKPYLDLVGPSTKEVYRPDFVVRAMGKTRYIETMGYTDLEYKTRKARVHKAMSRNHPVIQHHPGKDDAKFRSQIEAFIGY